MSTIPYRDQEADFARRLRRALKKIERDWDAMSDEELVAHIQNAPDNIGLYLAKHGDLLQPPEEPDPSKT